MIRDGKPIPAVDADALNRAVKMAAGDPEVIAFFATGGLARGRLHPLSDLDFAVLLPSRTTPAHQGRKHLELLERLTSIFRTDEIDLVILNTAPYRWVEDIIGDGKLLYCRDKPRLVDFVEHNRKLRLDFKYFRDQYDRAFLEGIGCLDG